AALVGRDWPPHMGVEAGTKDDDRIAFARAVDRGEIRHALFDGGVRFDFVGNRVEILGRPRVKRASTIGSSSPSGAMERAGRPNVEARSASRTGEGRPSRACCATKPPHAPGSCPACAVIDTRSPSAMPQGATAEPAQAKR